MRPLPTSGDPGGRRADFVTGATGFIGAALVLELLAESPRDVVCLVRAREEVTPEERLHAALREAAEAYGRAELIGEIERRCHAVEGDLTRSADALELGAVPRVDTVWHVAASLNVHDKYRDRTLTHNVEGTATALAIASELDARHYVHFSTAYVAGHRTGTILEEPVADPTDVNNAYEESKARAEQLVADATGLRTWIMRPGMVIGHSETHATLSDLGLYATVTTIGELKRAGVDRMFAERPLHLPIDPDARGALIPVDAVARNAWRIRCSDTAERIFHLTGASPPTVGEVTHVVFGTFGIPDPVFVDSEDELSEFERALKDEPRSRFLRAYLGTDRHFDLTNTNVAIGPSASDYPLGGDGVRPYVDWYVRNRLPGDGARSIVLDAR